MTMVDDLSEEAKAHKDLLWGMYSDFRTHGRHAETLRATMVNVVIVLASVLVAVIGNDRQIRRSDLPLCLALFAVGLFGFAFAASYTELHDRNRTRAMRFRKELDRTYFAHSAHTIDSLIEESDQHHWARRRYRYTRILTGGALRFWLTLPMLIMVTAAVLAVIAL